LCWTSVLHFSISKVLRDRDREFPHTRCHRLDPTHENLTPKNFTFKLGNPQGFARLQYLLPSSPIEGSFVVVEWVFGASGVISLRCGAFGCSSDLADVMKGIADGLDGVPHLVCGSKHRSSCLKLHTAAQLTPPCFKAYDSYNSSSRGSYCRQGIPNDLHHQLNRHSIRDHHQATPVSISSTRVPILDSCHKQMEKGEHNHKQQGVLS
jgi:hypothetical protein